MSLIKPKYHCFHIPGWHPHRLNEIMYAKHWSVGSKRKKADKEVVAQAALLSSVPKAESKRRVDLHIVLEPKQRKGDQDGWWKSILDALVQCGLLVDDDSKWCSQGDVTFSRGETKQTYVMLTELE